MTHGERRRMPMSAAAPEQLWPLASSDLAPARITMVTRIAVSDGRLVGHATRPPCGLWLGPARSTIFEF